MKTPREILLERHQNAAPKLDDIRRRCKLQVEGCKLDAPQTQPATFNLQLLTRNGFVSWCLGGFNKIWLELIFPCRRIWTGLAAIWLLILAVNFSLRDPSQTAVTKAFAPEMMSFNEQQKLLNELLADRSLPMDGERPQIFSPKPRTETVEFLTA